MWCKSQTQVIQKEFEKKTKFLAAADMEAAAPAGRNKAGPRGDRREITCCLPGAKPAASRRGGKIDRCGIRENVERAAVRVGREEELVRL